MDNLLELIGNQITPEVINAASSMAGTTPAQTQSAMSAAVPALVGSLLQNGSSPQGATQILESLAQQPPDVDMLGDFAGMLGGQGSSDMITQMGGSLMSGLLGGNQDNVLGMISSLAGIDGKSSSSLMKVLMPLGMAVLGKVVSGQKLDMGGLIGLLMGQKDFLKASAPPGLTDALGIGSFDDIKAPDLSALSAAVGAADAVSEAADAAGDAAAGAADAVSDVAAGAAGAAAAAVDAVGDAASGAADAVGDAAAATTAAVTGAAAKTAGTVSDTASDLAGAASESRGGLPTWAWIVIVVLVLLILWFLFFR